MNILNVCIDAVKTVGTELILIGIRPYYKYEDGKKVDKIEGYRYEIVLCQRKYERLFVKIAGDQRIPFNEDEGGLPVQFENLELHVYYQWKTGTYEISATATNIQTCKKG